MPRCAGFGIPFALLALAACGGGSDEEHEVMKPEETVFRDLVTAPGKVEDRVDAAGEVHRDMLQQRLDEGEGKPPEE